MWLLTVLLALMAIGSACPDMCECHPSGRLLLQDSFKRYVAIACHGKLPATELLLSPSIASVKRLSVSGSDQGDVTRFLARYETDSSKSLPHLESLVLTNCSLCALNVSWHGLENLQELNLSGNNLLDVRHAAVDDGLVNLVKLTVLDVSDNRINGIAGHTFRTFSNLVFLKMRANVIASIDENAFDGLTSLEYLDLADNKVTTLPSGALTPLDSLQKLDLSGNKLQVLGARWFESLARLRELDVSRNGLARAVSGVLEPLPGLSILRLAENPLRERDLSLLLGTGRRLETVDASRTGLVRVPAALTRSVRALRLAGNKLVSIRSGDLDSYPLLRLLDISGNRLTEVEEDALGRLEVLQELDISANLLSAIPRSLPSSLTTLDLATNAIAIIKVNDLQGLYNLQNLTMRDNAITLIEEGSFAHVPSLIKLDISNNPIQMLSTNALNGPNKLTTLLMSGLSRLEKRSEEGDMAFPVPTPERLVVLDVSYSPVLAAQLLSDDAALSACKSLLSLNLAFTNLTILRSDLAYIVPQLRSLGLTGNDWNCSEGLGWLGEWLRQHEELEPRARCAFPVEMFNCYLNEMPSLQAIGISSTLPSTEMPAFENQTTIHDGNKDYNNYSNNNNRNNSKVNITIDVNGTSNINNNCSDISSNGNSTSIVNGSRETKLDQKSKITSNVKSNSNIANNASSNSKASNKTYVDINNTSNAGSNNISSRNDSIKNNTFSFVAVNSSLTTTASTFMPGSQQRSSADRDSIVLDLSPNTTTISVSRKVEKDTLTTNRISVTSETHDDTKDVKPSQTTPPLTSSPSPPIQHSMGNESLEVTRTYFHLMENETGVPKMANKNESFTQNDSIVVRIAKGSDHHKASQKIRVAENQEESNSRVASSFKSSNNVFLRIAELTDEAVGSTKKDPSNDMFFVQTNSIVSNDIAKTIAEELNGQVTDAGSRLGEPLSAGAHPGMLVLAGAILGAAAVLTVVLSRRATRTAQDKYHRHENIEVHSLTSTTELW